MPLYPITAGEKEVWATRKKRGEQRKNRGVSHNTVKRE